MGDPELILSELFKGIQKRAEPSLALPLKSSRISVRLISAKPSLKNPSVHQNERNRSDPHPETPLEYTTDSDLLEGRTLNL